MKIKTVLPVLLELSRNGLGTPLLVVVMLSMLVVPLPPLLLDIFFTFNICLSLVVLLVTVYTLRPLNFAAFPTILLIATMLRLALNVASTRVVLVDGHRGAAAAGHVIESFGNYVVGGNYAVGLIVFAILIIINFSVITKGAGRVSEVSARFTLDSMPGKQMAIDADLNAGMISKEEAKTRREEIAREADFYGSMDGASKFVRGDAVAGILILFINVIGGLVIGMGQHGLTFDVAARNYTLLAVGDALVAQIPALLLSTATAILVTRVSASQNMGEQVVVQMFSDPRALAVTAAIIGAMGLVPGMPNLVFLTIASLCGGGAYWIHKQKRAASVRSNTGDLTAVDKSAVTEAELSWEDVKPVDIIGLEIGYRLIPLVDPQQGGRFMARIKGVRRKLSQELGFLLPAVHVRDNLELPETAYRITIRGVPEALAEIYPDRSLAINPGSVFGPLMGISTRDPAFQLEAVWIESAQEDQALALGYTVVDASTVVATHLSKILQEHAHELLGYDEVQQLLDSLGRYAPKLVADLVPKALPLSVVVKVLQNLLVERIPISDIRTIAETLAELASACQDADGLTISVRTALRRMIVKQINGINDELPVITLAPGLEQILRKSLQAGAEGGMAIEPGLAENLYRALLETVQRQELNGQAAVLLVLPALRQSLARLLRQSFPSLHVLAYNEVPEQIRIQVVGHIGGELAAPTMAA